jgi:hypothetical protein
MSSKLKLKRHWTAVEADDWTKEDFLAAGIGVLCFVAVAVGTPYAFLLRPVGFVLLAAGVLLGVLMLWIINPKLEAVSAEYEKKQKDYLDRLEKIMRWEHLDG